MAAKGYDYIIIGAGSAGCVLAGRPTEDGTKSVLLLEAGRDNHPYSSASSCTTTRCSTGATATRRGPPFHDRDVLVTACGRICSYAKKINISTVLAGQRLGIKEVDEGIWLVSFIDYDLGYIDLEQRTLQPLDNPFGPRLSPMS